MSDLQFCAIIINIWAVGFSIAKGQVAWLRGTALLWFAIAVVIAVVEVLT